VTLTWGSDRTLTWGSDRTLTWGSDRTLTWGSDRTLTWGSDRSDAVPPPPKEFLNTKLRAFIPGTSYLQNQ